MTIRDSASSLENGHLQFNLPFSSKLKKTMSDPKGVFDGKTWTPVVETEGREKPIPHVEDGDGTVFVSVASYRGKRIFCRNTLTLHIMYIITETLHENAATVITYSHASL
jgi:hypothetical protein